MAGILEGTGVSLPSIQISGLLSNSWIYVFIVGFIGLILISVIGIFLYFTTYNTKLELYENIAGQGYARTKTIRARKIRLSRDGVTVLRTFGGDIFSAFGRKVARNTYAFAKGSDGYWYNFVHGDLDAKFEILDIEPVDRDVRMFHVGVEKNATADYSEKKGFLEKYGIHMILVILVFGILIGFYVISGKISEGIAISNNPETAKINQQTADALNNVANKLDVVVRNLNAFSQPTGVGDSGLIPATNITTGGG